MMPPITPIDALSRRNCAATCPRVAPIARLNPISPGALHHADQRNVGNAQRPDNERQSAEQQEHDVQVGLHFVSDALRLLWNLHPQTARLVGSQRCPCLLRYEVSGPDTRLNDYGSGSGRPKYCRAVPSGMMTELSSSGLRPTSRKMPITR